MTVPKRSKRGLTDPGFSFFPRKNWRKFELEFRTEKSKENLNTNDGISKRSLPSDPGFSFFPRREWESSFEIPNAKKIESRSITDDVTPNKRQSGDYPSSERDCGTETRSINPLCLEIIVDNDSESTNEDSLQNSSHTESPEETPDSNSGEPSNSLTPNFQNDCGSVNTRFLNPLCSEIIPDVEPELLIEDGHQIAENTGSLEEYQNTKTGEHSNSDIRNFQNDCGTVTTRFLHPLCSEILPDVESEVANNDNPQSKDNTSSKEEFQIAMTEEFNSHSQDFQNDCGSENVRLLNPLCSEILDVNDVATDSINEGHQDNTDSLPDSHVFDGIEAEGTAVNGSTTDDDNVAEEDYVSEVINLLEKEQNFEKNDFGGVGDGGVGEDLQVGSIETNFHYQPESSPSEEPFGRHASDPNFVASSEVGHSQPPPTNNAGNAFSDL